MIEFSLVEYAGESYTRTPITSDKGIVLKSMKEIEYNTVITGGNCYWNGSSYCCYRIKDSKVKIIILSLMVSIIQDLLIQTASELAVEYGIKHIPRLGSNGMALSPVALSNGSFNMREFR